MMKHFFNWFVAGMAILLVSQSFAATSSGSKVLQQELNELITIFSSGSRDAQIKAAKQRVQFSGITDTRLFDVAEQNMLSIKPDTIQKHEIQYLSWMAKMLAFSGQEKYIDSLKKVLAGAKGKKVRGHVSASIELLPQYRAWNKQISKNLAGVSASGLERARVVNMLNAEDPELIRAGAGVVSHSYMRDQKITDLVEQRLLAIHKKVTKSKRDPYADATSWLCKILGNTGNSKYAETLKEVLNTTKSKAVKRWAQKSLQKLPQ